MTFPINSGTEMPRRVFIMGALATVATGALAACSPSGGTSSASTSKSLDPKAKATVTIWSWKTPAAGLTAAVAGFNKKFPNVKINIQDVGNPAIWNKVTTGLAAGGSGLPDIVNMGIDYIGNYAEKFPNSMVDLTSFGADKLASQFPAGSWKSMTFKNKLFGIPYEVNTTGLFYRKDLFEKAGVDITTIKTWDDLLEAGKKIKAATGVQLLSMDKAAAQADAAGLFQNLIELQGSFYFNADGEVTINNAAGRKALNWIKQANDAGLISDVPGSWDNFVAQAKGTIPVAVIPTASWAAGTFESDGKEMAGKWGVVQPPAVTAGGLTGAMSGGTYLSIMSASKAQPAAWAFINYALATLEGQQAVYKGGGLFPGFKPLLDSPDFTTASDYWGGTSPNKLFIDELAQDLPVINYTSDYPRALKAYTDAQSKVLLSGADPKAALDDAANQVASQTNRKIGS